LTVVTSGVHGVSRFRDVTALAGMALAGVWRRRWPLPFVIVVAALLLPLSEQVAPRTSPLAAIYVGLIPAYTVAAWAEHRDAWLGLAVLGAAVAIDQMIYHRVAFIDYAGPLFVICVVWGTGRAVRARRVAAATLRRATARLAAERDDRAELAIASERARIARDVHVLVANSVAAMVLQAKAARAQLSADPADPPSVDTAMLAIQSTGRQALGEMRRILGVLRHTHDRGELAPQPGVDQIHSMIQLIRDRGYTVEFTVRGQPGVMSAGVDLGLYRLLEEAFASLSASPEGSVAVELQFSDDSIDVQIAASCREASVWPTDAMRRRIALCEGELLAAPPTPPGLFGLTARMPRGLPEYVG
jgi:signal transduction histidine kinase